MPTVPLPVTGAVGILLRHRRRSHATRRAAAANVVLGANPASRLSVSTHDSPGVLVIAASPPPPPTTTSTPAQRFNRLRNVSFSSIPPFSSSGWHHNVFKPSYGLIFLPSFAFRRSYTNTDCSYSISRFLTAQNSRMHFQALNTAPSTHLVDSLDFGLDVVHSRLTVFVHSIQTIQQLWDALMCEGSMQPGRSFNGLSATPFSTDGWINMITYWTSVLTSLARSAPRTRCIRFHGVGFGSTLKEGYTRTSPRMRFEFEFGVKEDEILAEFETGTVVIGVRFSMLNKRSFLLRVEGLLVQYILQTGTTLGFNNGQRRSVWLYLGRRLSACPRTAADAVDFEPKRGDYAPSAPVPQHWKRLGGTGTQSSVPNSTQRRTLFKWDAEFFDLGFTLGAAFAFHLFFATPWARIARAAARELQNGDVSADVTAPTRSTNPSSQLATRPCAHKFSSIEAAAMERPSLETTLPLDLERHIFELYAHWRPVSIPTLMLVAWRVKVWVEPILYRTLLVTNDDPIAGYPRFTAERVRSVLESKAPTFLRSCVRNVYLDDVGDTTLELVLSQCTGIENLWIRHDLDNLIPLFARLSLKHLYADIRPLLPALSPSHPFFSQITHLELIGGSVDPSPKEMGIWSGLAHLPRLTHLSFNDDDFIDICSPLLQSCKFLVVLICLEMASVDTEADDRAMGTHAGVDYWTRAEDFVAKRRSGEMDALKFRISEDSSELIV
ncbi:hypothetical protein C8R43DRAFT_1132176 [Mycena crocata]|nr:hypothetical protein C8R43DRAFT_1132176 [Mycena crocata]